MTWAGVHRWCAIVLVALLVVWSVSGLLFHLKPGWDRAYDMLNAERGKSETLDTAIGPLTRKAGALVDAAGTPRPPLTEDEAKVLVADALSRSIFAAAYGELERVSHDETTVRLDYAHATVTIGRASARISQRGPDTERIDWLYRIHYLQWTGNATIDKVLAMAGLLLIWAVMIPGVVLFVRRLVRREVRADGGSTAGTAPTRSPAARALT